MHLLAHGLGPIKDLPVPTWLFYWGGAVVLVVSFALLGFLWRQPLLARHAAGRPAPVGLSAFLLLPLQAFHAYVCAAWIGPGLRGGGRARDLERGLGLDDMVRSLEVPLFGLAVPLLVWLSLRLGVLYR